MGFRFQKRISLGKLFRLNVSKTGVGASVGVQGLRLNTGPTGTSFTVGIPGTGLSYTKQIGAGYGLNFWTLFGGGGNSKAAANNAVATQTAPALPSPGMFASTEEKGLAKALEFYQANNLDEALRIFLDIATEPGAALLAADILSKRSSSDQRRALPLLESIAQSDAEYPSALMQKYLAGACIDIAITPTLTASVPVEGLAPVLLLTELYQTQGRMDEAIALLEEVESLAPEPVLTLSLCELYAEAQAWDELIERASKVEVIDNVTLAIATMYARALLAKNMADAASTVLTKALRSKKDRSPELLREAAYWRAVAYETSGKRAQARKEFEKIYAEDPNFRDVGSRLAA